MDSCPKKDGNLSSALVKLPSHLSSLRPTPFVFFPLSLALFKQTQPFWVPKWEVGLFYFPVLGLLSLLQILTVVFKVLTFTPQ